LLWNNPRIHQPEARKTWLACPEHRESLGGFLRARGFLRETEPFSPGQVGDSPPVPPFGAGA
jgi:hypothetical protein